MRRHSSCVVIAMTVTRLALAQLPPAPAPSSNPAPAPASIGPALLLGYRWYSNASVQWLAPTTSIQNHVVREGGLRLGILAGNEEQFDITALLTSSCDQDTPQRCLVSFA